MRPETTAPRAPEIARSPADVLRLVVAAALLLVLLLVEWLFGDTLVGFASDLLRGLDAVPQWIVDAIVLGTRVLAVVVLGGLLTWALYRRRWRMLGTVALAGLVAGGLVSLLESGIETDQRQALVDLGIDLDPLTGKGFPSTAGIGAVAAALTAAAPWLGRRARRAGWALMVGLMLTAFVDSPMSFDAVLAAAVGWLVGAAVLVAAGAPSRRPSLPAVMRRARRRRGPAARSSIAAGVDARGSTPYFGVEADGSKLFVKALGADERSADLLFRLYRRLLPRDFGDQHAFLSLQRAVEHEAFVALAARSIGVRTPGLRAVAAAEPNGYVLAYEAIDGKSLDRVDPNDVTDAVLAEIWRLVGELRRHRFAHRDLRLANIFLDDGGQVWLIDFGFGEVVASDLLLATDVAELLASSSLCVGPERAAAHAAGRRRRGDPLAGTRSAPPMGAQRGDTHGAQGPSGAARRPTRRLAGAAAISRDEPLVADRRRRRADRPGGVRRRRPQAGHRFDRGASVPRRQRAAGLALRVALGADAAGQPRGRHRRRLGGRALRPQPRHGLRGDHGDGR